MTAAVLVKYDAMCHAIDAAFRVDEAKDIRDKAVALETYARQAHNVEAERQACEIRLRAERKAGELSRDLEKSKGGRPPETRATMDRVSTKAEQLHAAGVTPRQAKQWEKLAAVPDEQFETALADRTQMPTTAGIIRAAEEPKVQPVASEALWLWGRLRDFERDLLGKAPSDVLETLTPEMKDDVHALAPRVAAWLKRIGEH
ncbi:hypothetical protein [Bradyrhizobium liaoningense]|uniref:hypothetical protein n=1 Tax=Bradyrhizobium liaoningense TaxID=43992 RepID=UPI001BA7897C|nr:hypothetical protein [Bradyrhizobium liaoningense]MBR0941018.1 hypothetical protein [Bradyrhizobium liaoningense]